jgi:hypothetical protein
MHYQEFVPLNGTTGFQKEERMWNILNALAIQ